MRLLVVTPPAPLVTWGDADAHLKLDGDIGEQAYVEGLIGAVCNHIDGPEGWLGRAIGLQTIEARLPLLGSGVRLPCPPHISVDSVKYLDSAGVEQTLDPSEYELIGRDLVPALNRSWPSDLLHHREAVRIQFKAGYDGQPSRTLPKSITAAILIMVADLYENRQSSVTGSISSEINMPTTVANLLAPFRVFD